MRDSGRCWRQVWRFCGNDAQSLPMGSSSVFSVAWVRDRRQCVPHKEQQSCVQASHVMEE